MKNIGIILILILAFFILFTFGCVRQPVCGNGVCEINENETNCLEDCGSQTHLECSNNDCIKVEGPGLNECTTSLECNSEYCGDGTCQENENYETCPDDCEQNLMICSALGGIICQQDENCSTYTLPASDSEFCCIQGICNNEPQNRVQDFNGILVIKENYEDEFTYSDDKSYEWIQQDNLLKIFFDEYPDEYDFIILSPKLNLKFSNAGFGNQNVLGICLDLSEPYPFTKQLKAAPILSLFQPYQLDSSWFVESYLKTTSHEIAHHWGCYIKGLLTNENDSMPGHWVSYVDLFYSDPNKVDIMGYNQWIMKDGNLNCINNNDTNPASAVFSDLTLYLMGLIPPEEVKPITIYDFNGIENYGVLGPVCYNENPTLLGTRKITIEDIILSNGERIPDYQNSQKDFKVIWLIPLKYDQPLDKNFINYVREYKDKMPGAWTQATGSKSKLIE